MESRNPIREAARLLSCVLLLLAVAVPAAEGTAFRATLAGKRCYEERQQLSCEFRVGHSLHFEIVGIGLRDTAVTFYKVDWDGDYYASYGVMHGCVIVKPGKKNDDSFGFAFVSPKNGKVYRSWDQCQLQD